MTQLPTSPASAGPDRRPAGPTPVEAVIDALDTLNRRFTEAGDARRWFAGTYLRTTIAVRDEIARGGFEDPDWVERWDAAFAVLYVDAVLLRSAPEGASLGADKVMSAPSDLGRAVGSGASLGADKVMSAPSDLGRADPPGASRGPWGVAFEAAEDPGVAPLRHVLLGLNAHINYDLAPSLLAVLSSDDFDDPDLIASRRRDCRHVDDVLAARVPDEDRELARTEPPGSRTTVDRLLTPFNRLGTTRFLAESRRKVWRNAELLDQARRAGPAAYDARMAELARLSTERVADLRRPGQVLLRLAVRGFGVSLSEQG